MTAVLNLLYLLVLAIGSPFWIYKALTTGKYREGLWRKFVGQAPTPAGRGPVVWLHAVSVGEVLLLRPLIARFRSERPDLELVLSTTTNTGHAVARKTYPDLQVFYAPFDFGWSVRRVFSTLRPSLLLLAELELWPNLLAEAQRRSVPVAVVNARMSERSFVGYRRLDRLTGLVRRRLRTIAWWGAQTEVYAGRIAKLAGPESGPIAVTGSMKYDGVLTDPDNPETVRLRRLLGFCESERIIVAGSTHAPEEEMLLHVFGELWTEYPKLRLVLAPRHPERFDAVAELVAGNRTPFVRRRALTDDQDASAPITLFDTIGELSALWGLADFGFVGGSLAAKRGGQSMIEPAALGIPVCFGPEVWNFRETVDGLLGADGAVQVKTAAHWWRTMRAWLGDPSSATRIGLNARDFIRSQQGAVDATYRVVDRLLPSEDPARQCA